MTFALPLQVKRDHGRAEIGGGLGQSQGEDGVLQLADRGDPTFGRHGVQHVEDGGDVAVVQDHILLLHLLQDVHCLWRRRKEDCLFSIKKEQ